MKKLDQFIVKSFLGPFLGILMVVIFILMLQFLWLYIDELVGKGLGLKIILEFLGWGSATMLPLALPLATLLASVMTVGQMAENNELIAMKSAGISLMRVLSPIIICAGISLLVPGDFRFTCNKIISVDIVYIAVPVIIFSLLAVKFSFISPHIGSQIRMIVHYAAVQDRHYDRRIAGSKPPCIFHRDIGSCYSGLAAHSYDVRRKHFPEAAAGYAPRPAVYFSGYYSALNYYLNNESCDELPFAPFLAGEGIDWRWTDDEYADNVIRRYREFADSLAKVPAAASVKEFYAGGLKNSTLNAFCNSVYMRRSNFCDENGWGVQVPDFKPLSPSALSRITEIVDVNDSSLMQCMDALSYMRARSSLKVSDPLE